MKFLERLRDQPAPSVFEIVVVFFVSDVPRIVGQVIASELGFQRWATFVVGTVVMVAVLIAYMAMRT